MSEYTREEILRLIEERGWPEGLDLSGKDLSGIDLGRKAVAEELEKAQERMADETPVWYSKLTKGINLEFANLQEANLKYANLQEAHLGGANLQRADLTGANLQGAKLWGADLQEAHLGDANLQGGPLWGANLQGANLAGANLQGADLRDANLQGAYLLGAKLQGAKLWSANLQGAHLLSADLQEADLGGAKLQGANLFGANLQWASLGWANLQGANLAGANLQGASLKHSHLERVDFFVARSLEGAYFYNAFLDDTRLKREQLGTGIGEEVARNYGWAKEAYLALKNNLAEIGRYDDAAWAYRKERLMEKLAALGAAREAWQKRDWKGAIRHGVKAVSDQLVEWICDYGEGIWRVLGSLMAVWIAFALIYGLIAGVWGPWQDTASGRIRYITRNPIDLLSFSLGAMTTIEPAGLGARPILAMRFLAPLEALLGIFFAGLLGFVAGNRIRRS